MILRKPIASGSFYPRNSEDLNDMLSRLLRECKRSERDVIGCVVPHAGYLYCGPTQAHIYKTLVGSGVSLIILGPNHRLSGSPLSVMSSGNWETPLGQYSINSDLSNEIVNEYKMDEDISSHSQEHSIETQIPWLQKSLPKSKFVPISMGNVTQDQIEDLGNAISKVTVGRRVIVMASSDFTHYGVSYGYTPISGGEEEVLDYIKTIDSEAIQCITSLDPKGFLETIEKYSMNVCGSSCIATMLYAVREWGSKGQLLDYSTSYPVSKSLDSVVSYASIVIE